MDNKTCLVNELDTLCTNVLKYGIDKIYVIKQVVNTVKY